jgi:predicted 2-oxoglutarate/Fe(II)-dependent dioxygenase YbiX
MHPNSVAPLDGMRGAATETFTLKHRHIPSSPPVSRVRSPIFPPRQALADSVRGLVPGPPPPRSAAADLSRPNPFDRIDLSLSPGDIAPDWPLMTIEGSAFSFYSDSTAGHTIAFLLVGRSAGIEPALQQFERWAESIATLGVHVYAVFSDMETAMRQSRRTEALVDKQSAILASMGSRGEELNLVILRANRHVAAVLSGNGDVPALEAARTTCERLQAERAAVPMALQPPLLTVPEVFSREECRKLISVYETRGQVLVPGDRADNYFDADYKMQAPEHMREDRVDHFFFEKATVAFLVRRLTRVTAEVAKAFQYQITAHETLRVARYHGSRGGYGHGHRDNIPPHQHRRFALSINLNTEEFEGGELRFPEFGDQRYRPETGAALVFSSSLLHEALQVTAGTRYVLLSFMFGAT